MQKNSGTKHSEKDKKFPDKKFTKKGPLPDKFGKNTGKGPQGHQGPKDKQDLPPKEPPQLFKDPIDPTEKGIKEKIDAILEGFCKPLDCPFVNSHSVL